MDDNEKKDKKIKYGSNEKRESAFCPYCMSPVGPGEVCPTCGLTKGAYEPAPHHLPPGTVLCGRYLIGRVLGEGGFGITYIGCDLRLEMKVAIKEYFPSDHVTRNSTVSLSVVKHTAGERSYEKGVKRFLVEARTMARMEKQPEIVMVRDYFEANDTAYIVMEYVDGTNFNDLVKQRGSAIPPEELFPMIEPLFDALAVVHKEGLLHRDISPDNLMLENGKVRLLDFGCAREASSGNETLTIALKQGYGPIEQYQERGQGPWTDVYALSATIYYCLTGRKPPQALDRTLDDELVPPRKLGVNISLEQERALLKGLAVNPKQRYQSVEELHAGLYAPGPEPPIIGPTPDPEPPKPEPDLPKPEPPEPDQPKTEPAIWEEPIVVEKPKTDEKPENVEEPKTDNEQETEENSETDEKPENNDEPVIDKPINDEPAVPLDGPTPVPEPPKTELENGEKLKKDEELRTDENTEIDEESEPDEGSKKKGLIIGIVAAVAVIVVIIIVAVNSSNNKNSSSDDTNVVASLGEETEDEKETEEETSTKATTKASEEESTEESTDTFEDADAVSVSTIPALISALADDNVTAVIWKGTDEITAPILSSGILEVTKPLKIEEDSYLNSAVTFRISGDGQLYVESGASMEFMTTGIITTGGGSIIVSGEISGVSLLLTESDEDVRFKRYRSNSGVLDCEQSITYSEDELFGDATHVTTTDEFWEAAGSGVDAIVIDAELTFEDSSGDNVYIAMNDWDMDILVSENGALLMGDKMDGQDIAILLADGHYLVNHGEITMAVFHNGSSGVFINYGEASDIYSDKDHEGNPSIVNMGTLSSDNYSGYIHMTIYNYGTINWGNTRLYLATLYNSGTINAEYDIYINGVLENYGSIYAASMYIGAWIENDSESSGAGTLNNGYQVTVNDRVENYGELNASTVSGATFTCLGEYKEDENAVFTDEYNGWVGAQDETEAEAEVTETETETEAVTETETVAEAETEAEAVTEPATEATTVATTAETTTEAVTTTVAETTTAAEVVNSVEYTAYLYFQTGAYSFRNAWNDSDYGINGSYNTDGITYDVVHSWSGSDLTSASGTFADATLTGNGTYTVSVSGLDWTADEFSSSDGTYRIIGISTTIARDDAYITVDEVVIGSTVFTNPVYETNGDSDYLEIMVEGSEYWGLSLGEYDATSSNISITFTISNL